MKYLLFTCVVGASLLYLASGEGKTQRVLEDIDIPAELSAAIGEKLENAHEKNADGEPIEPSPSTPLAVPAELADPEARVEVTSEPDAYDRKEPESAPIVKAEENITPPASVDTPATATRSVLKEELPAPDSSEKAYVAEPPHVAPDVAARRAEVLDFTSEDAPTVAVESPSDRRARLLELSDDMALFAAEMIAQ